MRKIYVSVLCAALIALSLAGCGGKPSPDPEPAPSQTAEVKAELAETYNPGSFNPCLPSVVTEIRSEEAYGELGTDGVRPASVILRVSADGNAKAANGETLGTLAEAYDKISGKIVPIFRAETDEEAAALIKFYKEKSTV